MSQLALFRAVPDRKSRLPPAATAFEHRLGHFLAHSAGRVWNQHSEKQFMCIALFALVFCYGWVHGKVPLHLLYNARRRWTLLMNGKQHSTQKVSTTDASVCRKVQDLAFFTAVSYREAKIRPTL